jgi:hypothetical protein
MFTYLSPSFVNATTLGVVRDPSLFSITLGCRSVTVATQLWILAQEKTKLPGKKKVQVE